MLVIQDLHLRFSNGKGTKDVLAGIDLTLDEGKLYAITGPNGGGKTSLAKIIMGIYRPTGGSIFYHNEDITQMTITERAQLGIAYAFQQPPRFKGLRVRDLLTIARRKLSEREMHFYLRNVGLCPEDYLDREVDGSLSGGEMKRIEIATLLAREAGFMIYDEPEAGVDLWTFEQLHRVLTNDYRRKKRTTLLITHNEKFLEAADEIILIAEGKIQERGNVAKIWPLIRDNVRCKWQQSCGGVANDTDCFR